MDPSIHRLRASTQGQPVSAGSDMVPLRLAIRGARWSPTVCSVEGYTHIVAITGTNIALSGWVFFNFPFRHCLVGGRAVPQVAPSSLPMVDQVNSATLRA